jgi:hypothetical protein
MGDLHTSCSRGVDAFACWCESGGQVARLDTEAGSAFDACLRAGEQCQELIEVKLDGESGSVRASKL